MKITDETVEATLCKHSFARRRLWWLHRVSWMRWQCVRCGETTRAYDTVDGWMTRPIHPHMSVAVPGYNTTKAGTK